MIKASVFAAGLFLSSALTGESATINSTSCTYNPGAADSVSYDYTTLLGTSGVKSGHKWDILATYYDINGVVVNTKRWTPMPAYSGVGAQTNFLVAFTHHGTATTHSGYSANPPPVRLRIKTASYHYILVASVNDASNNVIVATSVDTPETPQFAVP